MRKFLVWSVTVMFCIGAPDGSQAEEFDDQNDQWIPSLTFAVSVHDEDYDLVGDNSINFAFTDDRSRTMGSLRFGAELMTPVFEDLPAKPRFFGFAGLLWSTPGNGLHRERSDTQAVDDWRDVNLGVQVRAFARRNETNPSLVKTVDDFEGQGNRTTGRRLHNSWFLGVGSVFSFPMTGFTIRLRPSIEYIGEEIKTNGEYALLTEPTNNQFVINAGELDKTDTQHLLGPGFEIEFVNHLDSNVTLAFFTQTRFLWILNDRKTTLTAQSVDGSSEIRFSSKRNRFNFRGGIGFRFGFRDLAFNFK